MANEQDILQVHLDAAVIRIQELEAALSAKDQQQDHSQCHDLVCNGDRTKPRGAKGVSCSCAGRDAAYAESAAKDQQLKTLLDYSEGMKANLAAKDQQIAHLQAEVCEPNIWICETCGFTVTKAFLRASDGAVGIDSREVQDVCPNDGTSMRRQTFKESADAASKFAVDLMNRLNEVTAERDKWLSAFNRSEQFQAALEQAAAALAASRAPQGETPEPKESPKINDLVD